MGRLNNSFLAFAACVILCAAQPVQKLPVLKPLPAEVVFRVASPSRPFALECNVDGAANNIQYSWNKNGKPFDFKSDPYVTQRQDEGTLVFLKPRDEDEGTYQCLAESEFGVASSRIVSVKKAYINIPKVVPQRHKPVEGKPFKLDCPIPDAYPKPFILWMSQSEKDPLISQTIQDRRILQSPDGSLYFSNVTQEDVSTAFRYVCTAVSAAVDRHVPIAMHYIEGIVENKGQKESELVPQYLTQDMKVKVGERTEIYCIYGGTPLGHPNWFKDGVDVNNTPDNRITRYNRSSGRRLLIRGVILEDQGTYSCEVDNKAGKPQSHSLYLTVEEAPAFAKTPEPVYLAKQGQDVTIPCQIKGVPAPRIVWTYNAKPLVVSDRVSVTISGSNKYESVADLTIKNVSKNDKGYYGCRAFNDNGDLYTESLLNVA